MDLQNIKHSILPISDIGGTAGYSTMSASAEATQAALAFGKDLSDSMLLDKLCDRVYELLQEDMRSQRERLRNYGTRRW